MYVFIYICIHIYIYIYIYTFVLPHPSCRPRGSALEAGAHSEPASSSLSLAPWAKDLGFGFRVKVSSILFGDTMVANIE